jgi:nitrogen fixation protein FixH
VRASDKAGAPLRGLTVTATLVRPATETGKRALAFHEVSPGVYAAAAGPLGGGWDLDLTLIDAKGEKALADRRLRLP